ncbi:hypothetical protein ACQKOF_08220 [Lysinibacillus sp. NPDC093190]|uniref:hypothetical protein n=1 Tax=Lysinibacillus sp. NPDC093190 TaxID=3390575 RepID=UPI003D027BF5
MGISDRGTKVKTITSCDNAFVTNILLLPLCFRAKNILLLPLCFRAKNICWPKRLIGRPQESAQPERKSTLRFAKEPYFI